MTKQALGHLVVARRRPLPAGQRWADGGIVLSLVMMGVTLVLRATLPDNEAFNWSLVVAAAYAVVGWRMIRRARASAEVPANG
jgi:L-asparagine transporter-like permease